MFGITGSPSRRERILIRTVTVIACCAGVVAWALYDSTQWVRVVSASAQGPSSTVVMVVLDACVPDAPITVAETETDVRVSVDQRWDSSGDHKMCLTAKAVTLQSPVRTRRIIDAHGGADVPIEFASALPPPARPISGSVADVKGQEALATVTGWLVVHSDFALLCDELSAAGDSCATTPIEVDFFGAPKALPTDLISRGDVRVSRSPITVTGSLKVDSLYVGVTP